MTSFEAVVEYAGTKVKVKADSFAELHQTLAGVEELNRDAAYLKKQGINEVIPVYRKDRDENEYFGLQSRYDRRNVTFGTKREKGIVPFFPKGADGYYDPEEAAAREQPAAPPREPQASNGSRHGGRRAASAGRRPTRDDLPF